MLPFEVRLIVVGVQGVREQLIMTWVSLDPPTDGSRQPHRHRRHSNRGFDRHLPE